MVTIKAVGTIPTLGIITREADGEETKEAVDMGVVATNVEEEVAGGVTKILGIMANRAIVEVPPEINNIATTVQLLTTWTRVAAAAVVADTAVETMGAVVAGEDVFKPGMYYLN